MSKMFRMGVVGSKGTLTGASNCGTSSDHAKNLVITIDPSSPVRGANFTTTFQYDLDKAVTSGKAKYTASLNGLPVVDQTDDLCADQGAADPCPLAVGAHTDVSTTEMPNFSGKLVSQLVWTDQDSQQVLCVKMSFTY